MNRSYAWAGFYGLYFYALFQLVYVLRFGTLNLHFSVLDLALVLVGICSALLFMYFAHKLPRRRGAMLVPFLLAVPLAYVGALGGGLLGAMAVFFFGLVPFVILLPLGYVIIRSFFH